MNSTLYRRSIVDRTRAARWFMLPLVALNCLPGMRCICAPRQSLADPQIQFASNSEGARSAVVSGDCCDEWKPASHAHENCSAIAPNSCAADHQDGLCNPARCSINQSNSTDVRCIRATNLVVSCNSISPNLPYAAAVAPSHFDRGSVQTALPEQDLIIKLGRFLT
jgi:hypothetical protein